MTMKIELLNKNKNKNELSVTQLTLLLCGLFVISIVITSVVISVIKHDDGKNENKKNYKIWCVGNCNNDIQTISYPGTIFVGGGNDPIEATSWHIKNTNKGDYLILSAADYGDEYNDYVYQLSIDLNLQLNSVRTIQVYNRDASYEPEVLSIIRNSEGIFFEGGDQSRYINWWAGTEVQTIIQSKVSNVTLGGTSAGLAILGNWIYSAQYGSIDSTTALANPYDQDLTLSPYLFKLNFLETVITDTHFCERDRMGRMLTFVSRIIQNYTTNDVCSYPVIRSVGVDEPAALIINATSGEAVAVGLGNVYVCSTYPSNPVSTNMICEPNTPLTLIDTSCVRLDASQNDKINIKTWENLNVSSIYNNTIINGAFINEPYGPGGGCELV